MSKKTLCGLSCSCGVVFHPSSAAPTMEGFTISGICSPDCLSLPQIFFPAAGSHDNCITIINWVDDLEDYTQERSHSSVSAYVMHHLIWWHATLSSCSPIRLRVRSKNYAETWVFKWLWGTYWGSNQYYLSTIWLISGFYCEFHVGCKQTLKEPLSVFLTLLFACYHWFWVYPLFATRTPYIISLCFIPMHVSYCTQWNWTCRAKQMSLAW